MRNRTNEPQWAGKWVPYWVKGAFKVDLELTKWHADKMTG